MIDRSTLKRGCANCGAFAFEDNEEGWCWTHKKKVRPDMLCCYWHHKDKRKDKDYETDADEKISQG